MNDQDIRQVLYQECRERFPGVDCYKLVGYHVVGPESEIKWWMYVLAGIIVGKVLL